MEIKVRSVDSIEEKSVQEIEEQLLSRADSVQQDDDTNDAIDYKEDNNSSNTTTSNTTIEEKDVLLFIKNKYGKEIDSFDSFLSSDNKEELPSDVASYLKFKKETGRGFNDFIKYNENIDDISSDEVLARYYSDIEPDLDEDEIKYILSDKFNYDEDLDDENEIKKKQIAKKKELSKAKKHLDDIKSKYSFPLESSGLTSTTESSEELEAYKKYIDESKTYKEEVSRKGDWFTKKTDEVFNDEFKGFEFKMGDKSIMYSPLDKTDLKNSQLNASNFVSRYLDEDGMMNDAVGYHKALSMAMNPDKYAKFFYEQGKADAVESSVRVSKNIDMDMRSVPQSSAQSGTKIRSVGDTSGKGLRITSKK